MRQVSAEEREGKRNRRVGEFIQALTEGRGAAGIVDGVVTGVSVRLPTAADPGVLVVVRAEGAPGKRVGFVGGLDVTQAVLTWMAKDAGPGLKWREDVPWGDREG